MHIEWHEVWIYDTYINHNNTKTNHYNTFHNAIFATGLKRNLVAHQLSIENKPTASKNMILHRVISFPAKILLTSEDFHNIRKTSLKNRLNCPNTDLINRKKKYLPVYFVVFVFAELAKANLSAAAAASMANGTQDIQPKNSETNK